MSNAVLTPVIRRNRFGLAAVGLLALAIALVSLAMYGLAELRTLSDDGAGLASTYVDSPPFVRAALYVHIMTASLALLWGYSALRALRAIRNRDTRSHQAWMIRNFALTFAAVTLRLWVGSLTAVLVVIGGPDANQAAAFTNAYNAVPFLCWLPNLVVAEWLIRRRGLPSYRISG